MPAIASVTCSLTIRFVVPGLVFVVLTGAPIAYAENGAKSDWSKVQAVDPGRQATVLIYRDQAPKGARKVKGRFESASAEGVTLALQAGRSRTVERTIVRKVSVRRPFRRRTAGWVAAGASVGFWELLLPIALGTGESGLDLNAPSRLILHAVTTVPIALASFHGSRMREVYHVPPKHRKP